MGLIQNTGGDKSNSGQFSSSTALSSKPTRGGRGTLDVAAEWGTRTALSAVQQSAIWALRQAEKALGWRFDAAPAYLFFVEISGLIVALFTECKGLKIKRDVLEIKEGGLNYTTRKLPGRITYGDITLKRGLSLNRQLFDWFLRGQYDFRVQRRHCSIIQGAPGHNLAGNIVDVASGGDFSLAGGGFGKIKHWDVENAFPKSWEMSDLSTSKGTELVIETLELTHEGVSLSWETLTPMSASHMVLRTWAEPPLDELIEEVPSLRGDLEPECVEITSVTLAAPDKAVMGRTANFLATFEPDDATSPSYTWEITDPDNEVTERSGGDRLTYSFEKPGTHTVKVVAANDCSEQEAESDVEVECISISSVEVQGETRPTLGSTHSYTADIEPGNVSEPLTYLWKISNSAGEVVHVENAASVRYTFDVADTYTVEVEVENECPSSGSSTLADIVVGVPVESVGVSGPDTLATDTVGTFTATAEPSDATTPLEYLWLDAPESGQGTDTATYQWAEEGRKTVEVKVSNEHGSATGSKTVVVG
jgi:phage tail-like protein